MNTAVFRHNPYGHDAGESTAGLTAPVRQFNMKRQLSALLLLFGLAATASAAEVVNFNRDIRPLLSDRCFACHGPDANARQAELRLDVKDEALGHVIEPGDAGASELISRITSDDPDERMPPTDSRKTPLSSREIELIRRWIDQGANWQDHWAFVPPLRPVVPQVNFSDWPANPIDYFLLAEFETAGIEPSPHADRRTLVRRLSFDVLGLPPSSEEIERAVSFARDWDVHYGQLVDQLLMSPGFGERLASYWLDVVRYADSVGIHGDQLVSMSPFRDYVINAFNNNMPFDRFLAEQLAGDLLPGATRDQRIASAFNRLHMITAEGGAQNKEYLAIYSADRVRNTSAALMGVTMGCAQCHDHKFDPFSTKEFYEFAAFFADLKETGVYGGSNWYPQMIVPTAEEAAQLEQLNQAVTAVEKRVKESESESDARKAADEELKKAKQRRDDYRKTIRSVLVSESVGPREMRVLPRGNWLDDSGEVVLPGVPDFLLPLGRDARVGADGGDRATRLDLAAWLTNPRHPLVARVFVNRLWKLYFGRGIVPSLDDFGFQGAAPTYPELLDWLAIEFIESGWDVKHMIRLMVTSRAYRQSSIVTSRMREHDPLNLRFARQARFRLDGEVVRDNALAVSGLLVSRIGGRSVRPYQPAGYYAHLNFPRRTYRAEKDDNLWRRTVYTHWQRTFLHPSLKAFDAPTREECTADRPRSNTPLQSLVLLNDPIYVEAARALASRVIRESESTAAARISQMFRLALQRKPTGEEFEVLTSLVEEHRHRFEQDAKAADELISVGELPIPADMDRTELAAWMSAARVVLNLHEIISRY